MAELVGRSGRITVKPGLVMHVKVIDVKQAFGRTDVCVAPIEHVGGEGSAWVALDTVSWFVTS